jgi:PIN domain nuclease of toxin-antitoxin system
MLYLLDACALIVFLRGEPGAAFVRDILSNTANTCFAHWVNLCEVYYVFTRDADEASADAALRALRGAGVTPRADLDRPFSSEVARLRARIRAEGLRISLADCFCLATARRLGAEILTSDRAEFGPLLPLGLVPITFIR